MILSRDTFNHIYHLEVPTQKYVKLAAIKVKLHLSRLSKNVVPSEADIHCKKCQRYLSYPLSLTRKYE